MSPTITPPERRITLSGGGGGGGTTLPAAARARQYLASLSTTPGDVAWRDRGWLNVADYGAVGDGTTNNRAAFDAAFADMPSGGTLFVPPGIYGTLTTITVPNNVDLVGTGMDQSFAGQGFNFTNRSVIKALAAIVAPVTLGVDQPTRASGSQGATIRDLVVDGANLAAAGVQCAGYNAQILSSTVARGANYAVNFANGGGWCLDSWITQGSRGSAWAISGNDTHIHNNVASGYTTGVSTISGGLYFTGNHMFTGASSGSSNDIVIAPGASTGEFHIADNVLESCLATVIVITAGAGVVLTGITIEGNAIYHNSGSRPADTYQTLKVTATAAGAGVSGLTFGGSSIDTTNRDVAICNATGNVTSWSLHDLHHKRAQHILAPGSLSPDTGPPARCSVNTSATPGSNVLFSENGGVVHFVGDGSTGPFAFTHSVDGIGGTAPTRVQLTPATDAARAAGMPLATATATQIAITTTNAAAVGADLGWYWQVAT